MKKRILFILHLPPPVHGAAMVGKYIHDSKRINSEFDCQFANLTLASNLQDVGKVGLKKLWRFIQLLNVIRRDVKQMKPDLIYITPNAKGRPFYKEWIIVMMLKSMRCRIVAHYHNKGVSTRQERWFDDKLYRIFFKDLKVILLTERLYSDICKYVNKKNLFFCPNGIPTTKHSFQEHHNLVPHILFLSNLIESKGVFVLLDALKILQKKGLSFVCDFVGGETKEINTQRFADEVDKRDLNQLIVYHGNKYGEDKDWMFEHSDIFVFPTYYDTFPLVNLEAMSHYLPVVSTTEGGIPDVIKDGYNGLITKRKDSQSLADKIEILLNDKELREKMGEQGRRLFNEKFTIEAFEKRLCGIFQSIINDDGNT